MTAKTSVEVWHLATRLIKTGTKSDTISTCTVKTVSCREER